MLKRSNIYVTILICTAALITTSSSKKNFTSGKCVQEKARVLKLVKKGFQDIGMPLCAADGMYKERYYCMWTGSCFCVNRNGRHILARAWNMPPVKKGKCNVQRKKALKQIIAGVRNVNLPECNEGGGDRYKAGYHCDKGKCYCVDEYGKKTIMD